MKLKVARKEAVDILLSTLSSKIIGYSYNSACIDVNVLLEFVLHKDKTWLLINDEFDFNPNVFFKLVERRSTGLPIAYIVNQKEFYGLEFFVNESVLIPKPDTEILVELATNFVSQLNIQPNQTYKILDVCTGSGCIGISVMYSLLQVAKTNIELTLTDISDSALLVARKNAGDILPNCKINFIQADLRNQFLNTYDMILSNPPYVPTNEVSKLLLDGRNEPRLALDGGSEGLDLYPPLAQNIYSALKPNGVFFIEAGEYNIQKALQIFKKANFQNLTIHKDLANMERVLQGQKI